MNKFNHKIFWVVAWVIVVFGYLWLLSFAYDKEKGFVLFILLSIAGNLAYDGLKIVIRYDPLYPTDTKVISAYVVGFIVSLVGSIVSLIIGAELLIYHLLSEQLAQAFSTICFLLCMVAGMTLVNSAEGKFRATNRA